MTFRSFLVGPARYAATSPWPAWLAIVTTVGIVAVAQGFAALALPRLIGIDVTSLPGLRPGAGGTALSATEHRALMSLLLLSQCAIVGLAFATSRLGSMATVLKLGRPVDGWGTLVHAALGMLPLVAGFNLLAVIIAPELAAEDFRFFKDIAKAPSLLLTATTIGLGASLSEELLFRGFLLTSLAGTSLGFWPAACLATFGWTLLHLGYSWIGLVEVFLFGLYFSWLLWRTGSLWPSLFSHAVYNSSLLVVLRFWP